MSLKVKIFWILQKNINFSNCSWKTLNESKKYSENLFDLIAQEKSISLG